MAHVKCTAKREMRDTEREREDKKKNWLLNADIGSRVMLNLIF